VNQPGADRRRFLIVHNPVAGRGRRRVLDEVCGLLASAGAIVTVEQADGAVADQSIVAEARRSGLYDVVVAAGGDSTIRGVAAELAGGEIPLGIIPIGTGNVLAEEIGLVRKSRAIADCLLYGAAQPITPGLANGMRFFEMASAGFDVDVLSKLDMGWKHRIGKLAYGWPIVNRLSQPPRPFEIVVDGQSRTCTWVIVTKVAHYGGAFVIAPQQQLSASSFHAVVVTASTRREMAGVLIAIASGRANRHPLIESIRCTAASVSTSDVPVQIDGEPCGISPLNVTLDTARLWLIVPPARLSPSPGNLQ
jgi:diacylglycerol kinase (ATP)